MNPKVEVAVISRGVRLDAGVNGAPLVRLGDRTPQQTIIPIDWWLLPDDNRLTATVSAEEGDAAPSVELAVRLATDRDQFFTRVQWRMPRGASFEPFAVDLPFSVPGILSSSTWEECEAIEELDAATLSAVQRAGESFHRAFEARDAELIVRLLDRRIDDFCETFGDDPTDHRRAITGEFEWAANFERVLENGVDIAHAPFVHAGSFGNPDSPVVEDYEVVEILHEGWNIGNLSTVHLDPPEPSGVWKLISKKSKERPPIMTRTGIFFPNMTMLEVNLPLGTMRIFTAVVPVNANKSISKWTMMRSFFTGSWADKDSRRRTDKIFLEDQATVEAQRPELVPVDLSAELHVKSDANQIAYRRWRQGALDKGWGIDQHVVGRDGDYHEVRVIPSPSRRNNPELANAWVLKELDAKMKHETKPALATETTTESVDRA